MSLFFIKNIINMNNSKVIKQIAMEVRWKLWSDIEVVCRENVNGKVWGLVDTSIWDVVIANVYTAWP